MKSDIISINKNLIPYDFEILLSGEMFKISVSYNEAADLFILGLSKLNENTAEYEEICAGEPIIYGVPLWQDVFVSGKYPALTIIPLDESGSVSAITYDGLGTTTFLTIDNGGDENE